MPITIKDVSLEYKILPIEIREDGSCAVTVRKGYMDNGVFQVIEGNAFIVPTLDTDAILNVVPSTGLSRKDDLAMAIYEWLIKNNHITSGIIT